MRSLYILTALALLASLAVAQSSKPKSNKRPTGKPVAKAVGPEAAAKPLPTPEADVPAKRNGRPDGEVQSRPALSEPVYFYVFTRPGFTYSPIAIEHDEQGKGRISFQKSSFDEPIVDPVELSAVTLAKLKDAVAALNFLDSNEEYQYSRDYTNMGNTEITVKKNGRSRSVKYNWTDNKNAKFLMDEYRRIANEYIWRFELTTARANQPLMTPSMIDALDSYLKRGEISDPPHLLPFLGELSNDERLPLMARNHILKIIKEIDRAGKK